MLTVEEIVQNLGLQTSSFVQRTRVSFNESYTDQTTYKGGFSTVDNRYSYNSLWINTAGTLGNTNAGSTQTTINESSTEKLSAWSQSESGQGTNPLGYGYTNAKYNTYYARTDGSTYSISFYSSESATGTRIYSSTINSTSTYTEFQSSSYYNTYSSGTTGTVATQTHNVTYYPATTTSTSLYADYAQTTITAEDTTTYFSNTDLTKAYTYTTLDYSYTESTLTGTFYGTYSTSFANSLGIFIKKTLLAQYGEQILTFSHGTENQTTYVSANFNQTDGVTSLAIDNILAAFATVALTETVTNQYTVTNYYVDTVATTLTLTSNHSISWYLTTTESTDTNVYSITDSTYTASFYGTLADTISIQFDSVATVQTFYQSSNGSLQSTTVHTVYNETTTQTQMVADSAKTGQANYTIGGNILKQTQAVQDYNTFQTGDFISIRGAYPNVSSLFYNTANSSTYNECSIQWQNNGVWTQYTGSYSAIQENVLTPVKIPIKYPSTTVLSGVSYTLGDSITYSHKTGTTTNTGTGSWNFGNTGTVEYSPIVKTVARPSMWAYTNDPATSFVGGETRTYSPSHTGALIESRNGIEVLALFRNSTTDTWTYLDLSTAVSNNLTSVMSLAHGTLLSERVKTPVTTTIYGGNQLNYSAFSSAPYFAGNWNSPQLTNA